VLRYTRGVDQVAKMRETWDTLRRLVDAERFEQVAAFLRIQHEEAQWWRDACISYFQSIHKLPLPPGFAPPKHSLEYYQSLKFPYAPGRG
jgi:alpha-glucuronidase